MDICGRDVYGYQLGGLDVDAVDYGFGVVAVDGSNDEKRAVAARGFLPFWGMLLPCYYLYVCFHQGDQRLD